MKLPLSIAFILGAFLNGYSQPDLAGTWKGKIETFNLVVVFHLSEKGSQFSASMDSPDQGATGIPCDKVTINGDAITIEVSAVGGSYSGLLSPGEKLIKGKWNQGGGAYTLILGKGEIPPRKPKPQTPQPPFNYTIEEIEYDNSGKTVHLAGTLTFPSSGTAFPTAILISGSGQQNRDGELMGHRPFAVLADRLTRLGFAVLRVDDRGTGKSTGEVAKASSIDFAKDVVTSIEYLKKRKEVDTSRIGLIGHSEGGLIASIVASERTDINFVILLAGPGIRGAELLAEQGEKLVETSGVSTEATKAYLPLYKKMIALSAAGTDSAALGVAIRKEIGSWKKNVEPAHLKELGFASKASTEAILGSLIPDFASPWLQFFLASDPAVYLEKVSAKVLALNGEKDIQVLPSSNTAGIRKALQKSRSPFYEVKVLPGLNHLFQYCFACTVNEYGMLEESFSEIALSEITGWLRKNVVHE
ncbi:MAG: hypothetical protein K0Q66_397 [Chitinophagaceae bacterium]|nr:hypothetical protein [Chitinophagaceae bacterium]